MTIRRKLLVLLLSVTLVPLILIIAIQRFSFQVTGAKVTTDIRQVLDDYAYYNMESILHQFNMNLDLNVRLVETLLRYQVQITEDALTDPNKTNGTAQKNRKTADLPITIQSAKNLKDARHKGTVYSFPVDFSEPRYFNVENISKKSVIKGLNIFKQLNPALQRIYQKASHFIFWIHITLNSGVHCTYPKGPDLPKGFDPRKREWYTSARKAADIVWSDPYIDASTNKPMITVSAPFYFSNGTFAGVAGIDIHLPQIFTWMHLNPDWEDGAQSMLLVPEKNNTIKILAKSNMEDSLQSWKKPLQLETLTSADTTEFNAFLNDINQGRNGIRVMRYKGNKMIWVYGGGKRRVIALLVVPYKNLTELADRIEHFLWKKNTEWMRYSALFVLLVLIIVVIIVIYRSKKFTSPILALADAGQKLAEGDFEAKVHIQTGDELQQLGNIFNEIGPKLQEHQKMQQSLALAGAIQQRLLPKEAPKAPGFDMAGLCRYSDETGGDYYDFIQFEQNGSDQINIILGDVTGHGLSAALMMASARAMLRSNIRHAPGDISTILYEFNNELTADSDPDKFITLFLGVLDIKKKTITWASGGHDPAIRYTAKTQEIEQLAADGLPVGFLRDTPFESSGPLRLEPGDILLIGTDGIWEAENEHDEMFGKERLHRLVNKNKDKSAAEICRIIVDSVLEFCGTKKPQDDVTVVIVKVL